MKKIGRFTIQDLSLTCDEKDIIFYNFGVMHIFALILRGTKHVQKHLKTDEQSVITFWFSCRNNVYLNLNNL